MYSGNYASLELNTKFISLSKFGSDGAFTYVNDDGFSKKASPRSMIMTNVKPL